jgi:apolipoprotein D and lipocalin family protein
MNRHGSHHRHRSGPRPVIASASLLMTIVGSWPFVAAASASPPLRVVPQLDLQRYAGTWYEVARLPNRFEQKCARRVTATYALRDDGRIAVTNRCLEVEGGTREAAGIARRVAGQPPSVLEVRFAPAFLSWIPAVWGDYRVIELAAGYEHAVVGTEDRKYLWILSRTPEMEPEVLRGLLDRARAQGFAVDDVIRVLP